MIKGSFILHPFLLFGIKWMGIFYQLFPLLCTKRRKNRQFSKRKKEKTIAILTQFNSHIWTACLICFWH
jgi:hypothetical protein